MKNYTKLIIPAIILIAGLGIFYMVTNKKKEYANAMRLFQRWITMEREKGAESSQAEWVKNIEHIMESKGVSWDGATRIMFIIQNPSWWTFRG